MATVVCCKETAKGYDLYYNMQSKAQSPRVEGHNVGATKHQLVACGRVTEVKEPFRQKMTLKNKFCTVAEAHVHVQRSLWRISWRKSQHILSGFKSGLAEVWLQDGHDVDEQTRMRVFHSKHGPKMPMRALCITSAAIPFSWQCQENRGFCRLRLTGRESLFSTCSQP